MGVTPDAVGTAKLPIDEANAGLIHLDFGAPTQWNAEEPNPVVDERASPHANRRGGQDLETQKRRRDPSQILRVLEEREDLRPRARDELLSVETVHVSPPSLRRSLRCTRDR